MSIFFLNANFMLKTDVQSVVLVKYILKLFLNSGYVENLFQELLYLIARNVASEKFLFFNLF